MPKLELLASNSPLLPVVEAYVADPTAVEAARLAGGEINATYLVQAPVIGKIILQEINPAFGKEVVDDSTAVSDLMRKNGWIAPETVRTLKDDLAHTAKNGKTWRATTFIESSPAPETDPTAEDFAGYGDILGRFHATMAQSNYQPKHELPHFHDTDFYAGRLETLQHQMPDAETGAVAARLLQEYHNLPELPHSEDQLLHGDPRTNNMLFDEHGKPFTIIDLDTIMKGPIWIDIGDAMRSMAEDAVGRGDTLTKDQLTNWAAAYLEGSQAEYDVETFIAATVVSMKRIAIELSMRYANDIVDDNYFTWDAANFTSRRDNHLSRIATQMKIFTMFDNLNDPKELNS